MEQPRGARTRVQAPLAAAERDGALPLWFEGNRVQAQPAWSSNKLSGKYYLHGRSGHSGDGSRRFVLYQSDDGIHWKNGAIVSGDARGADGYSRNCIINKYDRGATRELMILYTIVYSPPRTSEYVFFLKPEDDRSQ